MQFAEVHRVIDGDTVVLNIHLGMDIFARRPVRLRNVNAPEINTEAGARAKAWLQERLGRSVQVETGVRGMYGRILGTIYVNESGVVTNVNDLMISEGIAEPY